MTNEEKQLLLKDLCARLPYGVKVKYFNSEDNREDIDVVEGIELYGKDAEFSVFQYGLKIDGFKPYLRPMSSMTEEEKSWYESLRNALTYQENGEYDLDDFNELNDFLNRKKLDRYGLIEKGLALEAPEGMYNI